MAWAPRLPVAALVVVLAAGGCGDDRDGVAPSPEASRTPVLPLALPVDEAAERLAGALDECLGREGFLPSRLGGRAPILREVGARSPGAVATNNPPLAILHVVYSPAEARAVVENATHLELVSRGRVVYEPGKFRRGVRPLVVACIDEAERAAPVAGMDGA